MQIWQANAYKILIGKPEGKRSFGRLRHWWEHNIKMDVREIGWEGVHGSIWLRIGTSGGILWTRSWTFGFHKRPEVSWLAEWL